MASMEGGTAIYLQLEEEERNRGMKDRAPTASPPASTASSSFSSNRPASDRFKQPVKKKKRVCAMSGAVKNLSCSIRNKKIGQSSLDYFNDLIRERNNLLAKFLTTVAAQENESSSHGPAEQNIPSICECIKELKDIPTLPYRVYLKATMLFTDPDNRLLFSVIPSEDKVEWLIMMTSK